MASSSTSNAPLTVNTASTPEAKPLPASLALPKMALDSPGDGRSSDKRPRSARAAPARKQQRPRTSNRGTSMADKSPSWRKVNSPSSPTSALRLSAEAKPFVPSNLSATAAPFEPKAEDAKEETSRSNTTTPRTPMESPASSKFPFSAPSSTRSTASGKDEKYDYFNPYDSKAPEAFRKGIDAIYGLPYGGSLAFVFDGTKGKTCCKGMGEGLAEVQVQLTEKISVQIKSGGINDGDMAQICINGKDYCPNQRGVNILVVDPSSLDAYVGVFDTHTHIGNESSHLTRFLTAVPEKHIVLIAIRYDATRRLHPEARQALHKLGVEFPEIDNVEALAKVVGEIDPNQGADLLSMASTVNAWRCAELLIRSGWDVNHRKRHGSRNSPLLDAVFHGSVDVIRVLLEARADVSLQNKWHETATDIATKLFGFNSLEEMVEHTKKLAATS